jgi:acetyl esterase/lipase
MPIPDAPATNIERVHTVVIGLDVLEESERYADDLRLTRGDSIHERDIELHRENGFRGRTFSRHDDVSVKDRSVSVDGHDVVVRQFLPNEGARGAYLHFHGGGWVFGSASIYDDELADLSHDLGIAVFSVDYRLAPEHPFPAAMDDAEIAARWLLREGLEELNVERAAIGGWSAGAHLAAIVVQRLRANEESISFCAANLLYGIYDLSMTPSQRHGLNTPRLSRADLEWYYELVLPLSKSEDRRAAENSPLYGDLAGMPPARFAVGTLDPLFDDSVFMAERWAAAGSPTRLEIYAAGAHGFARQQNGLGRLARQHESEYLSAHFHTVAGDPRFGATK